MQEVGGKNDTDLAQKDELEQRKGRPNRDGDGERDTSPHGVRLLLSSSSVRHSEMSCY